MWKDTREDRLNRYKQILQQCPELYRSAPGESDEAKIYENFTSGDLACNDFITEDAACEKSTYENGISGNAEEKNICEKIPENEEERNVYDYVLAPALHGFVCWVLREAVAAGTKRLYFLARDGYLMYQAADKICKKLQLPISCKYLSCSRYSIRVPMYHRNYTEALEYICRGGIDLTMDRILNRGALEEQEKQNVLEMLNEEFQRNSQTMFRMQENIPYAKLEQIRQALEKNIYFRNCIGRQRMDRFHAESIERCGSFYKGKTGSASGKTTGNTVRRTEKSIRCRTDKYSRNNIRCGTGKYSRNNIRCGTAKYTRNNKTC